MSVNVDDDDEDSIFSATLGSICRPVVLPLQSSSTTEVWSPRLLNVQSHVVHGYVGSKANTYPLQTMGFDVSSIYTTILSNRPGYKNGHEVGHDASDEEVERMVDGLSANNILDFDIILSGYNRRKETLDAMAKTVNKARENNPAIVYVCDPVMGDDNNFYVPKELLEHYKKTLLPLATVITPNKFEAEQLAKMKISTIEDAVNCCKVLHELGPSICFITGLTLDDDAEEQNLSIVASLKRSDCNDSNIYCIKVPVISGKFSGCGDLFAALISAGIFYCNPNRNSENSILQKYPFLIGDILEMATTIVSSVLKRSAPSLEINVIGSTLLYRKEALSLLHKIKNLVDDPAKVAVNYSTRSNPAFLVNSFSPTLNTGKKIGGIIFDMDGTLTLPGLIDFNAMFTRNNFDKNKEPCLFTQIANLETEEQRAKAWSIVVEEEMKGCARMELQPDLHKALNLLIRYRVRMALSTRNCYAAYADFLEKANLDSKIFSVALARDCLNGINKPDPKIVNHITSKWNMIPSAKEDVWFVGDSVDDLACGKAAGCKCCLLVNHRNKHLIESRPELIDLHVDSLYDAISLILEGV